MESTLPSSVASLNYTLKMINPLRMSEYKNVDLQTKGKRYDSLDALRDYISANLPNGMEVPNEAEMGYIEPGHGGKGRKIWLHDDSELEHMYDIFKDKKRILLWCYTSCPEARKKKDDTQTKADSSNYSAQVKKQDEVSEIYSKLKEKHEGKFKPEQLNTWAHMLHLKTHDSFDVPPNKPFFNRKRSNSNVNDQPVVPKKPDTDEQKISIRSQLIDQLKKSQELIDCGAIDREMFDELQRTIISDIKGLSTVKL